MDSSNKKRSRRNWGRAETLHLLESYMQRIVEFECPRRKLFAYQHLLDDLICKGVLEEPTTTEMLEQRMKTLLRAYKTNRDNESCTGAGPAPCVAPFMKEMDEIFGRDRKMDIPSKRRTRRNWGRKETLELLECYMQRMVEFECPRKKRFAYQHLLDDLVCKGVLEEPTTTDMVEQRIKTLLRAYKTSWCGAAPCVAPFMKEMDEIFGNRKIIANQCMYPSNKKRKIDIDKLIQLVKSQPCLWDNSCEEYKNRDEKEKAWLLIVGQLFENWEEKPSEEKTTAVEGIKSKWKSIRDRYVRNNNAGKSDDPAIKRKYKYANSLKFLKKSLIKRRTSGNMDDSDPGEESSVLEDSPISPSSFASNTSDTPQPHPHPPKPKKPLYVSSTAAYRAEILKKLDAPIPFPPREPDNPHKFYLLSLLPNYSNLRPEDQLDFQVMVSQFFMDKLHRDKTVHHPNEKEYPSYGQPSYPSPVFPFRKPTQQTSFQQSLSHQQTPSTYPSQQIPPIDCYPSTDDSVSANISAQFLNSSSNITPM